MNPMDQVLADVVRYGLFTLIGLLAGLLKPAPAKKEEKEPCKKTE